MIHYRASVMLLGSIKDVLYGILTLNSIDLYHCFVQSLVPSIKKNASQDLDIGQVLLWIVSLISKIFLMKLIPKLVHTFMKYLFRKLLSHGRTKSFIKFQTYKVTRRNLNYIQKATAGFLIVLICIIT